MDTIGIVCEADHPVFGRAAERLAARGFGVEFFSPGEPLGPDALDGLDALANTVLSPRSFAVLREADRAGLETWNGYAPTTMLSCRLLSLHALDRLGCQVPSTGPSETDGDAVERARFRWDQPTAARADVPVERVRTEPVTYRYYAVDDGVETHVHAMVLRSELDGYRPAAEEADVDVELATRVRELLDRFGARTVAVDFVATREAFFAVDVDPAPDFFGTDLDRRIADSIASLATIGA
ncbi:hypothetical protein SAMN05216559_2500 [Halomicrobium zhouii]|uniref:ATP-grasp domain-containing protein n=1 Tax=Halomicrobium zhouii TaxID=767519 RepID=A0A1I6LDE8_9EURY|nr:hypothetical protein [Halomicrobium zhouii]SFS01447.1 hypothetical protein SAMN05216559_2500 [Halomicrobium zhouii]